MTPHVTTLLKLLLIPCLLTVLWPAFTISEVSGFNTPTFTTPTVPDVTVPNVPSTPNPPSPPDTTTSIDTSTPTTPTTPNPPSPPSPPGTPGTPNVTIPNPSIPTITIPNPPTAGDISGNLPDVNPPGTPSLPCVEGINCGSSSSTPNVTLPSVGALNSTVGGAVGLLDGAYCGNNDVCMTGETCYLNACRNTTGLNGVTAGTGNKCSSTDCCRNGLVCNSETSRCTPVISGLSTINCQVNTGPGTTTGTTTGTTGGTVPTHSSATPTVDSNLGLVLFVLGGCMMLTHAL